MENNISEKVENPKSLMEQQEKQLEQFKTEIDFELCKLKNQFGDINEFEFRYYFDTLKSSFTKSSNRFFTKLQIYFNMSIFQIVTGCNCNLACYTLQEYITIVIYLKKWLKSKDCPTLADFVTSIPSKPGSADYIVEKYYNHPGLIVETMIKLVTSDSISKIDIDFTGKLNPIPFNIDISDSMMIQKLYEEFMKLD